MLLSMNLSMSASVTSLPTIEAKLSGDDEEDKRVAMPLGAWGCDCATKEVFALPLQATSARKTTLRVIENESKRRWRFILAPPVESVYHLLGAYSRQSHKENEGQSTRDLRTAKEPPARSRRQKGR